jgi:hypothetical protein
LSIICKLSFYGTRIFVKRPRRVIIARTRTGGALPNSMALTEE